MNEALARVGLDRLPAQVVGHLVLLLLGAAERRGRGGLAVVGGHLRQVDLVGRVQVEVLLRGDVGRVRAEEAARQEERPVLVRFEQLDDLGGDLAVGLLLVGPVGGQPAQGTRRSGRSPWRSGQREDLVLVVLVAAAGLTTVSQLGGSSRPSVPIWPGTP